MPHEIRTAVADDYDALCDRFSSSLLAPTWVSQAGRDAFEPDRALVVDDGATPVATTRALSRTLSVPGGVIAAAHVTGVGVAATHRRRGLLTDLMRHQLSTVPESVAVLWASEPGIYERFGYHVAAYGHRLAADLARLGAFKGPTVGGLREITASDAPAVLTPLLERYQSLRPGVSGRDERHWEVSLADPPEHRGGWTAHRYVVHYCDDRPEGYLVWRSKLDSDRFGLTGAVDVVELVAVTEGAYRSLWRYVLTMDLATSLTYRFAAVDEPVGQLVANPRALGATVSDALWVRITDVAEALSPRRYTTDIDLVVDITDDFLPAAAGRFRLTGGPESAACVATDADPDLSMSIAELSAIYLGGRRLTEFAALGKVTEHRRGAVAAATAAFGWSMAPQSIEVF